MSIRLIPERSRLSVPGFTTDTVSTHSYASGVVANAWSAWQQAYVAAVDEYIIEIDLFNFAFSDSSPMQVGIGGAGAEVPVFEITGDSSETSWLTHAAGVWVLNPPIFVPNGARVAHRGWSNSTANRSGTFAYTRRQP